MARADSGPHDSRLAGKSVEHGIVLAGGQHETLGMQGQDIAGGKTAEDSWDCVDIRSQGVHGEFEGSKLQELELEDHREVADGESQQKGDRKIDLGLRMVVQEDTGLDCKTSSYRFVASLEVDKVDREDCAHSN